MYVGIDVGTGSLKAVIGTEDGLHAISARYPEGILVPEQQGCHNIRVFLKTLDDFMSRIASFSRSIGRPLSGIGFCGHGPSLLMIDKDGSPLTDMITWQNRDAALEARELRVSYPGFSKDGTCLEAKLLKMWKENPAFFSEGCRALYPKDYLIFLLTGEMTLDHSTAATLEFYDADSRTFDLEPVGIPSTIFPSIVESEEIVGRTGTEESRRWGLPTGIPVVSGGIDAWCEALGAGAVEPGEFVDGTGTSTCLSCCKSAEAPGLVHVLPGRKLSLETISSTGGTVKWLSELVGEGMENLDREWGGTDDGKFLRPCPVLFLPYLHGERSPVWDEKASVSVTGLTGSHQRPQLMSAMVQGIAFATRQCFENLDSMGTEEVFKEQPVRAVGGGAAGRALIRYKADITGRAYQVMQEKDAAPLGAMILAACGCGEGSLNELVMRWCKTEYVAEPSSVCRADWDELYKLYCSYFQQVQNLEHKLFDYSLKLKQSEKE